MMPVSRTLKFRSALRKLYVSRQVSPVVASVTRDVWSTSVTMSGIDQICSNIRRCSFSSSTGGDGNDSSATADTPSKTTASDTNSDVSKTSAPSVPKSPIYVHPLSQIVLMYFQSECHDWICGKGLESSLKIHRDGSFELGFPEDLNRRIWTYYDPVDKKHWLSYQSESNLQSRFLLQDNRRPKRKLDHNENGLHLPPWKAGVHGNPRRSLAERVEESVRELMAAVDESGGRVEGAADTSPGDTR